MQLVSRITLDTFDINKYLTIKQLSRVASWNIGKYFLVSYILLLFHEPLGEKIFPILYLAPYDNNNLMDQCYIFVTFLLRVVGSWF